MMKRIFVLGSIILISVIALIPIVHKAYVYLISDLRIPERVDLSVGSTDSKGQRVPLLVFSTHVPGSYCNYAGNLKFKTDYTDDALHIEIVGYRFKENPPCPAMAINESEGVITVDLNWLKSTESKKIFITLNGSVNEYMAFISDHYVRLIPGRVSTVGPRSHQDDEFGYPLSLSDQLIPLDVGIISLSGYVKDEKDYTSLLENLAIKYGYALAQNKYPELSTESKSRIYIISDKESIPNKGESRFLEDIGVGKSEVSARVLRPRNNDSY